MKRKILFILTFLVLSMSLILSMVSCTKDSTDDNKDEEMALVESFFHSFSTQETQFFFADIFIETTLTTTTILIKKIINIKNNQPGILNHQPLYYV